MFDEFVSLSYWVKLGISGGLFWWWARLDERALGRQRGPLFFAIAVALCAPVFLWPLWGVISATFLGILSAILWARHRSAREAYEPASARFEGGGIKRGLTGPEAAALMGKPLNLILALALTEMLHKGFLVLGAGGEDEIRLAEPMQTWKKSLNLEMRAQLRRRGAQSLGKALHPFEEPLLELLDQNAGKPWESLPFGLAAAPIIRHVAARVAGYDFDASRSYYEKIVSRAPVEARTDGRLVTERQKVFDRNLAWLLLNPDYKAILDQDDHVYQPLWYVARGKAGKTFADWFGALAAGLSGSYDDGDLVTRLGSEQDVHSARLIKDISQATFHS